MAKRLTAAERIDRLTIEGYSRKEIAKATGYSASQIGRVVRGETTGKNMLGALREFSGKGSRAQAAVISGERSLKSAKPAAAAAPKAGPAPAPRPAPRAREVSPIARATGQLKALDKGGVEKVLIHMTNKETGKSFTLGSRGGINVDTIRSDGVGSFVSGQAAAQLYDDDIDLDVYDIDFEEYY